MGHDERDRWRVPGLDGLRALAILLVIVWHVVFSTRFPTARFGPLEPFVRATWSGVDLFFALSGFLITSLMLREERRNAAAGRPATFSLRRFYLRRTLRILPTFYVVFALLALVLPLSPVFRSVQVAQLHASGSRFGLWPYATFWGNYFASYASRYVVATSPGAAFGVFWSLCVEEHFYLLWPLFLRAVRGRRARVAAVLCVCAALPVLRFVAQVAGFDNSVSVHNASHFRFDSLLWGALAALTLESRWLDDAPRRALLAAVTAVVALLVGSHHLGVLPRGSPFGDAVGLSALALGGALLVADFARRPEQLARRLDAAPLRLVGRLSYAMYLVHIPMIDVAKAVVYRYSRAATLGNLALLIALTTALSVAVAWVLHRLVERPFLKLKARFG
jgi:peptidoglycan/LPS O-acetylase OafA/YrhL